MTWCETDYEHAESYLNQPRTPVTTPGSQTLHEPLPQVPLSLIVTPSSLPKKQEKAHAGNDIEDVVKLVMNFEQSRGIMYCILQKKIGLWCVNSRLEMMACCLQMLAHELGWLAWKWSILVDFVKVDAVGMGVGSANVADQVVGWQEVQCCTCTVLTACLPGFSWSCDHVMVLFITLAICQLPSLQSWLSSCPTYFCKSTNFFSTLWHSAHNPSVNPATLTPLNNSSNKWLILVVTKKSRCCVVMQYWCVLGLGKLLIWIWKFEILRDSPNWNSERIVKAKKDVWAWNAVCNISLGVELCSHHHMKRCQAQSEGYVVQKGKQQHGVKLTMNIQKAT